VIQFIQYEWTKIGTRVAIRLDNSQDKFQLHGFTTNTVLFISKT